MKRTTLVLSGLALLVGCGDDSGDAAKDGDATGWGGEVTCTFYDGEDHVERIDTLVCVEGGGDG